MKEEKPLLFNCIYKEEKDKEAFLYLEKNAQNQLL
jgi:hypothetical protein